MPASGNLPQRLLRLASSGRQRQKTPGSAAFPTSDLPASEVSGSGLDTLFHMIRRKMVCSRKRIYRLMQQLHIQSARRTACRSTTNSKHSHPIAPNLLRQYRTKPACRLCAASADEFSVISHRNSLQYASIPTSFLCNLTKNLLAHLPHNLCAVLP